MSAASTRERELLRQRELRRQRELLRQQSLLRALNGAGRAALQGWAVPALRRRPALDRDRDLHLERGLQAYRANAAASAERALAARYPTVQMLLGDASFALLARHLWQLEPPRRGDLAMWGHGLPAFVAASAQLADTPYLADVARLDAAVHAAEQAADAAPDLASLALLAPHDAADVALQLAPGSTAVVSAHPLVAIWQAHHGAPEAGPNHETVDAADAADGADGADLAPDRPATDHYAADHYAAVREAFMQAAARAEPGAPFEAAWVWRDGWTVRVQALAPAGGCFVQALAEGDSLAAALDRALAVGPFDFEAWLVAALRDGAVLGARRRDAPATAAPG